MASKIDSSYVVAAFGSFGAALLNLIRFGLIDVRFQVFADAWR